MHNLFGDRFLRLFAGDLQHRKRPIISNVKYQIPEAKAEDAVELVDPASEEGHEKNLADGNLLPDGKDQNKQDPANKKSEIEDGEDG